MDPVAAPEDVGEAHGDNGFRILAAKLGWNAQPHRCAERRGEWRAEKIERQNGLGMQGRVSRRYRHVDAARAADDNPCDQFACKGQVSRQDARSRRRLLARR